MQELYDLLQHHGVKGMKWGIRKDRSQVTKHKTVAELTTKHGKKVAITEDNRNVIAKGLRLVSKHLKEEQDKTSIMSIRDVDGKKLGSLQTYRVNKDELNLVWMDVKKENRGQGIASTVMEAAVRQGKELGVKKLTLEVPGDSKDAHHIYKKAGFKDKGKISDDDDMWGGLTKMELDLRQSGISDDILLHFGVKGMKWGVRKKQESSGSSGSTKPVEYHKESNKAIKMNADGSQTIPKGFAFNRVGQAKLDINDSGALYVSHGKEDASRYIKSLGPTVLGKMMGQYGTTVQHLSTKGDIKMPSDKEVVKVKAEALLKNDKALAKLNDSIYASSYTGELGKKITKDDLNKVIKDPSSNDAKKLSYAVGSFLAVPSFSQEAKGVYNEFKKKGYDAIPDVYDRLGGVSKTAMIVINPSKLEVKSTTLITKDVMKAGKAHVKEVGKMKPSDVLKF